jgi:pyridoxine 5-phosphate synthase
MTIAMSNAKSRATRLSVNLNKLALLRNQRDIGYPDLCDHAQIILQAGAHGLTVHPRPDERHIRYSDMPIISDFVAKWNDENYSNIEFNIEGYPDSKFMELVCTHYCDQVTLVPDAPDQKTSDHGWDMKAHADFLQKTIKDLQEAGRRVSLFIDPDADHAKQAADLGADRVELYTGPYATGDIALQEYVHAAVAAQEHGLGLNAGHDLNLDNLAEFIKAIPNCAEVSIGHALTADALKYGWAETVRRYLACLS